MVMQMKGTGAVHMQNALVSSYTRPDYGRAFRYAIARLERQLPAHCFYHSVRHTRDDVVPAVERLAAMEGLGEETMLLLRTAAAFHDIGFVRQSANHEIIGIRIATATLPQFGFNAAQVRTVAGLIRATRLPQSPRNLLEQIMADADLDALGRDDFFHTSANLRAELAAAGSVMSDGDWYRSQLAFLSAHTYFTRSAHVLRAAQKQRNLEELAARSAAQITPSP